ncbi:MAG TPA: FHA domain-containing protein [Caldilineaceae bacterium]|nr:FHA domain-containing protein [Caldilineaceae bacterium]
METYNRNATFLVRIVLLLAFFVAAEGSTYLAHAQDSQTPTLQIVNVDTTHFPQVAITLRGSHLPAPLADLPLAITLDGKPLTVNTDESHRQGIQVALAVDSNQLVTRNEAGQSGFVELTGTLLDLVEANVFARNQDWLAAYHLQGTNEPRLLESWTQEPNQLFNSVVSNRPAEIDDAPLTAAALNDVIRRMTALPEAVALPKVLLLFSTGATLPDLTEVVDTAQREAVAIHVVELLNSAPQAPSEALQTLAAATGGHYTALASPEHSAEVINALNSAHTVRTVQTRVAAATPQELRVTATLPDNSTLEASTADVLTDLSLTAAEFSVIEPADEIRWETLSADPTAGAAVRLLPIQATVAWPDGHVRELVQVSYTLRGPGDFAAQEIRTEAPFTEAQLSLSTPQEGSYTLEIRALDELGMESTSTTKTFTLQGVAGTAPEQDAVTSDETSATGAQIEAADQSQTADTANEASLVPVQQADASAQPSDSVQLPGVSIAIPRSFLLWLLPVLLLLIGYLIYSERRARRQEENDLPGTVDTPFGVAPTPNPLYDLPTVDSQGEKANSRAAKRYELDGAKELATQRFSLQPDRGANTAVADAAAQTGSQRKVSTREQAQQPVFTPTMQGDEEESRQPSRSAWQARDEAADWVAEREDIAPPTEVPTYVEDEEATYRTQEVARPVLGLLVRTTGDPNLPKELPIYNVGARSGEVRQIHIGRHRQHNTIVINDKRVSREHAIIIQRDGHLYLRDNASTAGTFLNWKRLNPDEELLLRHNDLIGFGQVAYEFHLGSEEDATVVTG